jgi:3-phenylpropionate/cinnamic acid dioxygenase small subunit
MNVSADDRILRQAVDELEIRNTVARLSHLADSGSDQDIDEYLDVYLEDGAWAPMLPPGSAPSGQSLERRGRDQIRNGVLERRKAGLQGPGSHSKHFVTTTMVTFQSDDEVVSRSNFIVYNDTDVRPPTVYSVGEYRDYFTRSSDGWKLVRREIYPG